MKRKGYLFDKICSIKNLKIAEKKARRGKTNSHGVLLFDKNAENNLINSHHTLLNGEYKTSEYTIFTINEGKERQIYRLPYYPDRICHHSIMNVLERIFVKSFTKNTYSCIRKRGIHKCLSDLKKALLDKGNTIYCLKLDITKFYPSIDNDILKKLLRTKFKDLRLLKLLNEIIESSQGQPIGNYLSQFFANFYLSKFDHYLKEELKIKYYFRYCDDLVILGKTKEELWKIFYQIKEYLNDKLNLKIKPNYQLFPVTQRGIDFVGYKTYHTHTLLRKSIKTNFIKMLKTNRNEKSIASYNGWIKHGNCINLRNKYLL